MVLEPLPRTSVEGAVLIVNFGGQYTHLIARRVREQNVYSYIVDYDVLDKKFIEENRPCAIILSGGPYNVYVEESPLIGEWLFEYNIPVLGICYGAQLIAYLFNGSVSKGFGEYGRCRIEIVSEDPIIDGWNGRYVWMSHRDYIVDIPDAEIIGYTGNKYIAIYRIRDKPVYGVQFHPEVSHTDNGSRIIENFLFKIAGCKKNWFVEKIVDQLIKSIRETIGYGEKVLVAVSGGVDSTVTAYLLKKALGSENILPVFIDHGLFREGEVVEVLKNLREIDIEPIYIDASKRFYEKLVGVSDCEERRRIIGEVFAEIFIEIASKNSSIKWFAQGTTYPDIVESGYHSLSDRIKSHHNVAGLPEWFNLKRIEPLKYFYKDEVRRIGRALGLPDNIVYRKPFPGPGLAVRIIGEFSVEKLEIVRRATYIVENVLKKHGIYDRVWQAFAVVGDDRWIGVKGDKRVDGYIVTIRIVESEDGMTADYLRIPYEVLDEISSRITGELERVTMVTYSITTKPPSTIEPC